MDPLKLTPLSNTRYSITLSWREFKEPGIAYRLQLRDRLQGWVTKYWLDEVVLFNRFTSSFEVIFFCLICN